MGSSTVRLVVTKSGKEEAFTCPLLQSEYVRQAARDCVIVPNVNPAYKAWVASRMVGYEACK